MQFYSFPHVRAQIISLKAKYIVGVVVVVGNEPFTKLAIQTSPSKVIILDCDKETKNFLLNNQGKTAKIYYEKIDDTKTPNVIIVLKTRNNFQGDRVIRHESFQILTNQIKNIFFTTCRHFFVTTNWIKIFYY